MPILLWLVCVALTYFLPSFFGHVSAMTAVIAACQIAVAYPATAALIG